MKLSTIFIINAIVAAVYGIVFVLIPGPMLSLYAVTVDSTSTYLGQIFGAALVSFAILSWLARNADASPLRNAIVLSFLVNDGIGFLVSLIARLAGVGNALGWTSVVVYLILALAFAYAYFGLGRGRVATAV